MSLLDHNITVLGPVKAENLEQDPTRSAAAPLKRMRDSHHGLARLVAKGLKPVEISAITGYTVPTIYAMQNDPSFKELVEHYRLQIDTQFVSVVDRMKILGLDTLQELHTRLQEEPEAFSVTQLKEIMTALLDRTGHGPSKTNTNLNLNAQMSQEDLAALRKRVGTRTEVLLLGNGENLDAASDLQAEVGETVLEAEFDPAGEEPERKPEGGPAV